MPTYNWKEIPREQMNPLVARQVIHGDRITIARLTMAKGAFVPVHSHVNEQISTVESGRLEFVLDGEKIIVAAGQSLVIPSNVPHSAEALEDSVAVDVFSPVREDWLRGDDSYLRK